MRPLRKAKTHTTAVVLIPPEALWEPIQTIRRRHDRQMRRWMPHITLLYPFRPRAKFDAVAPELARSCADIGPFELTLARFRYFDHGGGSFTIWLAPEPPQAVVRLQEALLRAVPDCDDIGQFEGGFTPHLSVGQVEGQRATRALVAALQRRWRPLPFTVWEAALLWRGRVPNDVFRVDRTIALSGGS